MYANKNSLKKARNMNFRQNKLQNKESFRNKYKHHRHDGCNPSYCRVGVGESQSKASLGKSVRSYLKNKLKAKPKDVV
jgi:hypothetical protein